MTSTISYQRKNWGVHANPNLDIQEGEIFPDLEELSLPFHLYVLSAAHCVTWSGAMNWTHLRRLDLGRGAPKHLFTALAGNLPNLKTLRFGFWSTYGYNQTWECPDMSLVCRFLDNLNSLEDLDVESFDMREFQELLRSPNFNRIGGGLRKLRASFGGATATGFTPAETRLLVKSCPQLRVLHLMIAMETDNSVSYRSTIWVRTHAMFSMQCLEPVSDEHSAFHHNSPA
jgi:hypothetical protein